MTLLAAIGSPFGDDAIALELLESLEPRLRDLSTDLSMLYCDNPLTDLLPALASERPTILIDAIINAAPDGRVTEIDTTKLLENPRPLSSHALSVASVLQLSEALGQLPRRLCILGIHVHPEHELDQPARQRAERDLDSAIRHRL